MITAPPPVKETIWFDITFESSYWRTPPIIEVFVDQQRLCNQSIIESQETVSFQTTLLFGPHTLSIHRSGKDDSETRVLPDGTYQTQTLCIKQLLIDKIDVRNLIWDDSVFEPVYPEPWATEQKNNGVDLACSVVGELIFGHNGVWQFDFSSPFYQYLVTRIAKK